MRDETFDRIAGFFVAAAWYAVALGSSIAVWEGNDTTTGGAVAATAGIFWVFIVIHAIWRGLSD